MNVDEVIVGECVQWEGNGAQNRTLKDTVLKGPKAVETTKVIEKQQPGKEVEQK